MNLVQGPGGGTERSEHLPTSLVVNTVQYRWFGKTSLVNPPSLGLGVGLPLVPSSGSCFVGHFSKRRQIELLGLKLVIGKGKKLGFCFSSLLYCLGILHLKVNFHLCLKNIAGLSYFTILPYLPISPPLLSSKMVWPEGIEMLFHVPWYTAEFLRSYESPNPLETAEMMGRTPQGTCQMI